jgi:hypothetical protein
MCGEEPKKLLYFVVDRGVNRRMMGAAENY